MHGAGNGWPRRCDSTHHQAVDGRRWSSHGLVGGGPISRLWLMIWCGPGAGLLAPRLAAAGRPERQRTRRDTVQPLAATEQARRTSLWRRRWTEGTKPTVRNLATVASKQAGFSTRRSREKVRRFTEQANMALRAAFDRALREAPTSFSSVSSHVLPASPC